MCRVYSLYKKQIHFYNFYNVKLRNSGHWAEDWRERGDRDYIYKDDRQKIESKGKLEKKWEGSVLKDLKWLVVEEYKARDWGV